MKKLDKYLGMTEEALGKVKILDKKGKELVKLAKCYFSDAKHFKEKKDLENAMIAVCYAHAMLDAGVRIGVLEGKDNRLFMCD
jgi:hypothetical protein